ncbi:MAG TPA: hypothetical protein VEH83_00855 [Gemmatimonadales bacterium]|nr:hypothetical protein [Gemmatimonadales bacterium]
MASRRGAALLRARGYKHTDSGLWFDAAKRKVFTDEYLWRRDATSLDSDLAEEIRGTVKVYSSWPLAPDAASEVQRILGSPERGAVADGAHASFSPGSWDARRHKTG